MQATQTDSPRRQSKWFARSYNSLWETIIIIWSVLILTVISNIVSLWLLSSISNILTRSPLAWVIQHSLLILPIGVCLLLLTLIVYQVATLLAGYLDKELERSYLRWS